MALFPLGILSAAGAGGDYELISSTILGSNAGSITFSSLGTYSATYKHLQIRATARTDKTGTYDATRIRVNGDTGIKYWSHILTGNGTAVASVGTGETNAPLSILHANSGASANIFAFGVIDLLDAYATKNKTFRVFSGMAPQEVYLTSTGYFDTAALTSLEIAPAGFSGNFVAGSRFSLYGIKG